MKPFLVIELMVLLGASAIAADHPAASLRENLPIHGQSASMAGGQNRTKLPPPFFCKGKHCLYYAGDFDVNNTGADGICFMNNGTSSCETVVGVRPNKRAVVTGGIWNADVFQTVIGTNPTPFEVRVGVSSGNGGKVVCATSGNATMRPYQGGFGVNYVYIVKKFFKPCVLAKGKLVFVGLQPQYTDGASWGFLLDAEDIPPPNHHGWKNVPDETFSNYPGDGLNWAPAGGPGGFCGGSGCDVFSIALTGIEQ